MSLPITDVQEESSGKAASVAEPEPCVKKTEKLTVLGKRIRRPSHGNATSEASANLTEKSQEKGKLALRNQSSIIDVSKSEREQLRIKWQQATLSEKELNKGTVR